MTTRSATILTGVTPAARGEVDFTCPPNSVVLIKSIAYDNRTATILAVTISLQRSSLGVNTRLVSGTLDAQTSNTLEHWWVMEPGDRLAVYSDPAGMHFWISGAELPVP